MDADIHTCYTQTHTHAHTCKHIQFQSTLVPQATATPPPHIQQITEHIRQVVCPGSQAWNGNNKIASQRKVSCGPGRGRKEGRKEGKAQGAAASPSEKLRPCCPRGNGALPRIAKHGRDGGDNEIIKSAGWNDRMNRSPREGDQL